MAWGSGRYAPEPSVGMGKDSEKALNLRGRRREALAPAPSMKKSAPYGSKRTFRTPRPGRRPGGGNSLGADRRRSQLTGKGQVRFPVGPAAKAHGGQGKHPGNHHYASQEYRQAPQLLCRPGLECQLALAHSLPFSELAFIGFNGSL